MRNTRLLTVTMMVSLAVMISGCSQTKSNITTNEGKSTVTEASTEAKTEVVAEQKAEAEKPTSSTDGFVKSSNSSKGSSTTTFTNAYGTPTTKCAHSGCNNYIASSGDTCYCTTHSKKCLECGKYIDEDAMYCLDCIAKAAGSSSKNEGSSYGNSSSNGSSSYSYGNNSYNSDDDYSDGHPYDPNDPYYSANDHDGDGKINDQEFQDALNDAIDDLLAQYGD